jgi:hypothetical protein
MAKFKFKSLSIEKNKIEKEVTTLIKRLKIADTSQENLAPLDALRLLETYILDLSKRAEINKVLGIVETNDSEETNSTKIDISLNNGLTDQLFNSISVILISKGADEELANKLTVGVFNTLKNAANPPVTLTLGKLMKNKFSFTVDKVTHSIPVN